MGSCRKTAAQKEILEGCAGEDVTANQFLSVNKFLSAIFGNKSALYSFSGKDMSNGPNDQILTLYPGHDRPGEC
ncbi:hypothetical protein DEO72_LG11g3432 [Vigna unguiculata]|uniref:Uncharacterized protein n=1 Tax=Vigna unguiculata TaxID=3917 RepID=A0A4D6NWW1_VIGUN|nr:hypothetical protein DEO72_LG11g3432 [Vigna unguiculata]